MKKGEYVKAKRPYLESLDILDKIYGTDHTLVAKISSKLGNVERELSNFDQAQKLFQKGMGSISNIFAFGILFFLIFINFFCQIIKIRRKILGYTNI